MNWSSPSTWLALATLITGSSVIATIVTTFATRGKIDAEETKVKADAAKVLSDLAIEQARVLASQVRDFRDALKEHREWDRKIVRQASQTRHRLAQLGAVVDDIEEVGDPPELWI